MTSRMAMSHEEIYRILPYSGHWRMLQSAVINKDRIEAIVDWTEHPMCCGHFKDLPVIPGIMVYEAFGHTAALHAGIFMNLDMAELVPVFQRGDIECMLPVPTRFSIEATRTKTKTTSSKTHAYRGIIYQKPDTVAITINVEITIVRRAVFRRLTRSMR